MPIDPELNVFLKRMWGLKEHLQDREELSPEDLDFYRNNLGRMVQYYTDNARMWAHIDTHTGIEKSLYFEYKGNRYRKLYDYSAMKIGQAWIPCVIYQSQTDYKVWVRELGDFEEKFYPLGTQPEEGK